MHWLSECAKATDEQKAELRRKLRAQREERGKKAGARLKRLRECLPPDQKTVTLNDLLAVPYCYDSGADRAVVSRQYVNRLERLDSGIRVEPLSAPILNVTVGEHAIKCTGFVRLRCS